MVKNLHAIQEMRVQSLDWEDPLEKGMTTHSSNSCMENSMDRGGWLPTVYGVTKSWIRLNIHSSTWKTLKSHSCYFFLPLVII